MSGRIRSLKPEWLEDEALIGCSDAARVASAALILLADDHGNGRGSERYLGAQIFPGESLAKVREALASLVAIRYVGFYEVDGQTYFAIRNWEKHQKVDKPGKPRVPRPLEGFRDSLAKIPVTLARSSRLTPIPTSYHDQDHDQDHSRKVQLSLTEVVSTEFDSRGALESAPRVSPKKQKPVKTEAEQAAAAKVRHAFQSGYAKVYGRPITGWGAKENAHIYELLKTWPAQELMALAVRYFAWAKPECIKAGHPFVGGYASFSAKLHELHADIIKPERRADAAGIDQQARDFDVRAANESTLDRVFSKLGAQNGELGPATEQQRLEQAPVGNSIADGRTQPEIVGRGNDALGQKAFTIRQG
jgi:hypothetical protein